MMLEIGECYSNRRGDSNPTKVMGFAKTEPIDGQLIVWAVNGNWYRQLDGHIVLYSKTQGHFVLEKLTPYDLITEVPTPDYWK